jgi:hypothetical protein
MILWTFVHFPNSQHNRCINFTTKKFFQSSLITIQWLTLFSLLFDYWCGLFFCALGISSCVTSVCSFFWSFHTYHITLSQLYCTILDIILQCLLLFWIFTLLELHIHVYTESLTVHHWCFWLINRRASSARNMPLFLI